jgi:hypothetical protein
MEFRPVVTIISVLVLCVTVAVCQQSGNCSKLTALSQCYPPFPSYVQRGVNLTMAVKMVASGTDNVTLSCRRFQNMTACVDSKLTNCSSIDADPNNPIVLFWNRASEGIKYVCVDKLQEILDSQKCLATGDVIREVAACDKDHEGEGAGRHARHTCADFEAEVKCADVVVTMRCGAKVGELVGKVTRIALRTTPHTKDCQEPPFASGSSKPAAVLPACLAGAALLMTSLRRLLQ